MPTFPLKPDCKCPCCLNGWHIDWKDERSGRCSECMTEAEYHYLLGKLDEAILLDVQQPEKPRSKKR